MILQTVTPEIYAETFPHPRFVYDSVDFSLLNRSKTESLVFVTGGYSADEPLLGITLGFDGRQLRCPFSAPSGYISYNKPQSIGTVTDFFAELSHQFAREIRITLPAMLHADNMMCKVAGALNSLASRRIDDFNFHIPLPRTDESLRQSMAPAARRNLRRALSSGLRLVPTNDIKKVYDLIAEHHRVKGYHMAMTADDVMSTAKTVPTDCFTVTHQGKDIAAVYIHRVSDDTVQLINWGSLPEADSLRPMNFMAYALPLHYSALGPGNFDFGPASTGGVPNAGLCRFKEDIGARISLKHTYII